MLFEHLCLSNLTSRTLYIVQTQYAKSKITTFIYGRLSKTRLHIFLTNPIFI